MRKHGGTPSRRDKHVTLAAISPPGVARGRFVGGQQSGLAGCKPPPLFTRGASSCSSQGRRQGEPWGASPRPSAPTYLPTFTLLGTSRSNGDGVGELIYALSSLFITANAYYDIQVTFQTVSMQISGGLVELLYGSVWMDGDIQLNSGKVPPPVPSPNTPFSGPFYGQATSTECEFRIICCRTASRLTTLQRMQCPKVSTQACA